MKQKRIWDVLLFIRMKILLCLPMELTRIRYPNTDWLGLAIQNSVTTRHGLEASGGTDKVKYLVSAGVDHQTGVFPQTSQNVFNVRSSTDISITKKFGVSFDLRYQLRDMETLNAQEDTYKQILASDPTMVAYYTDGTYGIMPDSLEIRWFLFMKVDKSIQTDMKFPEFSNLIMKS